MQWDYKTIGLLIDDAEVELANLYKVGREGWELVSVRTIDIPGGRERRFYFKRPLGWIAPLPGAGDKT